MLQFHNNCLHKLNFIAHSVGLENLSQHCLGQANQLGLIVTKFNTVPKFAAIAGSKYVDNTEARLHVHTHTTSRTTFTEVP